MAHLCYQHKVQISDRKILQVQQDRACLIKELDGTSADPEKHEKFTQSKFDIFFSHKPFSGFYNGNSGQMKKFTPIWKNLHKHGLQVCVFFQVWTCVMAHQREARTATTELLTWLTWFTISTILTQWITFYPIGHNLPIFWPFMFTDRYIWLSGLYKFGKFELAPS